MTLATLATACRRWPDRVVTEALPEIGQTVKRDVLAAARADTGGDLRLSRLRAGKVAVSYDVAKPDLIVTPVGVGAWSLLEGGSRQAAWWIPRNRKGRKRLTVGSGVRWYVRHGPVRGRHTWTRAQAAALVDVPELIDTVAAAELGALDG